MGLISLDSLRFYVLVSPFCFYVSCPPVFVSLAEQRPRSQGYHKQKNMQMFY